MVYDGNKGKGKKSADLPSPYAAHFQPTATYNDILQRGCSQFFQSVELDGFFLANNIGIKIMDEQLSNSQNESDQAEWSLATYIATTTKYPSKTSLFVVDARVRWHGYLHFHLCLPGAIFVCLHVGHYHSRTKARRSQRCPQTVLNLYLQRKVC